MDKPNDPAIVSSPTPILKRRAEIEAILADYHIGDHALETLHKTPFVLMVAATAAGRNTIMKRLVNTGRYYYIVSDTTRPKRVKDGQYVEHEGVEYFFRDEDSVVEDLKQGKFIEAAVIHGQQVSGISIREIEKAHDSGRIAISDIEPGGWHTITDLKPDAVSIYLLPPSFEEWLIRMRTRSNLSPEEVKNRLESAVEEFQIALRSDRFIFVINDDLDEAERMVDETARLGKRHENSEQEARILAAQLREDAMAYLLKYPNW